METDSQRLQSDAPAPARFTTTHWSVVVAAGADSSQAGRAALEQLSRDIDAVGTLAGPLESPPAYGPTMETALKKRPELSDLKKRVQIYEELVTIYKAGTLPRIDFKAGWGWKQLDFGSLNFGNAAGEGQAWHAGVYFSFPFFDGLRTQGKVLQAKTDFSNLKIDEAKLLDSIALQVRDALNYYREAEEIVQALT